MNALCDYRLKEAVRVQFDRFAKGFGVLGQSSIERVVEAEELRVMVQGDEAPLDWAALQDVCAYEGFGEAVGGADDAAMPPVNDDMSADVEGSRTRTRATRAAAAVWSCDRAARRRQRRRRADAGRRSRAAARRAARNPRDVPGAAARGSQRGV